MGLVKWVMRRHAKPKKPKFKTPYSQDKMAALQVVNREVKAKITRFRKEIVDSPANLLSACNEAKSEIKLFFEVETDKIDETLKDRMDNFGNFQYFKLDLELIDAHLFVHEITSVNMTPKEYKMVYNLTLTNKEAFTKMKNSIKLKITNYLKKINLILELIKEHDRQEAQFARNKRTRNELLNR